MTLCTSKILGIFTFPLSARDLTTDFETAFGFAADLEQGVVI